MVQVAQVWALFVSSSSPCFMRTLSDSLFNLSFSFTFLLFIIFSFQHFLLLFTFLEVVDNSHAHCRGAPGLQEFLHKMKKCAQSMLRLLTLPALFIHGNLDIISSTTSYLIFNTFHLQPTRKEKLTNPGFRPFSHSEIVYRH